MLAKKLCEECILHFLHIFFWKEDTHPLIHHEEMITISYMVRCQLWPEAAIILLNSIHENFIYAYIYRATSLGRTRIRTVQPKIGQAYCSM